MEVVGRYEVLHRIGSGGMAEVFLARARGEGGFEKLVAIKRILPHLATNEEFVAMFIDEARISATLSHSNIGQIFEFGHAAEGHFLAMEYVPGIDLRVLHRQLRRARKLAPGAVAAHLIQQVCAGLEHAHAKCDPDGRPLGIIHRDVSPSNVLVSFDGDVKLIDFGIAKAARRMTETVGAGLKGKYAYMSPEQATGREVDARSDIFGAGTLLFELLTGLNPFLGDNDLATLERVRRARVPSPSAYAKSSPPELEAICLRALAREPLRRYQSAADMGEELERYMRRAGFTARQMARWMRETFAEEVERHSQLLQEVRSHAEGSGEGAPRAERSDQRQQLGPPPAVYELIEPIRERGDPLTGPFPRTPTAAPRSHAGTPVGKIAVPAPSSPGLMPVITSVPLPVRRTPLWLHLVGFALFALVVAAVVYVAVGRGSRERATGVHGALEIEVEPPQAAQVFIDDEIHGATDTRGRYLAERLLPGKHRVKVSGARMQAVETIVEVEQGRARKVTLRAVFVPGPER